MLPFLGAVTPIHVLNHSSKSNLGTDATQDMFRHLSSYCEPAAGQPIISGLKPAASNCLRKGYRFSTERRSRSGRYILLLPLTFHTPHWSLQRTCASAEASSGVLSPGAAPPHPCASHDPVDDGETCDAQYQAAIRKAEAREVTGALEDLAALSSRYPNRQDVLLTAVKLHASTGNLLAARQLAAEASAVVSTTESLQVGHVKLCLTPA